MPNTPNPPAPDVVYPPAPIEDPVSDVPIGIPEPPPDSIPTPGPTEPSAPPPQELPPDPDRRGEVP